MKTTFSHIGLAKLCGWFGITRQAYYEYTWNALDVENKYHLVINKVNQIREDHPRLGTRKLYDMLQPFFKEHQIKMGRDSLFNLLYINNILVRKRKRKISTTNSYHRFRKYPNLIREFIPTAPNQLWVSDITYWKIGEKHVYISFITDAFSHKIVGYYVAETLETIESIKALRIALNSLNEEPKQLIHHSDRGIQYCSNSYVKLLQDYNIKISMTENGDPLENAIAERINGIMKEEYLNNYQVDNINEATELLKAVVNLYNNERPHMSISNLTPEYVHQSKKELKLNKLWKNYYKKSGSIVKQKQDLNQTVNLLQD
jgi:putative transposase